MSTAALEDSSLQQDDARAPAWRIAVIGCGPRGMYCLERLAAAIRRTPPRRPVEVTIYDQTDQLGAGPVYSAQSPLFLRMNFASRQVDVRPSDDPQNPSGLLSLVDWLAAFAPDYSDPNGYAPRAIVGRYLSWSYQQIVARLPTRMHVEHVRQAVHRLEYDGHRWAVGQGTTQALFDEVVVTVGHEGWRPISDASAEACWPGVNFPQLRRLFPIDHRLEEAAPPGSTVVTRGFALCWIDAALALTEGRGGRFLQEPHRYSYAPSGKEPKRILPWSRTGRPMWAKVDRRLVELPESLDTLWGEHSEQLQRVGQNRRLVDFRATVWPAVTAAADAALARLGRPGDTLSWFRRWQKSPVNASTVRQTMLQGFQTATGQRPLDEAWALGESWRQLYPVIVDLLSHGGLADSGASRFWRIAGEMERLAFGPPAENVGRILALIDAGIVDLSMLGQPANTTLPNFDQSSPTVAIETRIPGPEDLQPNSVVAQLLQDGYLSRQQGSRGIQVDPAGRPLDCQGRPTSQVAVLGRVTEGVVLGNDTLSRRLHQHPSRWALAVTRRMVNEEATVGASC